MSKQIRLDDDVYERLRENKRDDETYSEAVERALGGRTFGDLEAVFDDEQVSDMRNAIDEADRRDRQEADEVADRLK
ncbi:DUF7557 family protein [Halosegnis longus]|uniref:Uncharacterized protein n=1 Tax=Halosegnis longus TaxID=2216012 RepID=A0AAJ4R7N4_9EURY|nr:MULTISPECIES: antitoxin VapB family protein [Halobacteriales]RNJ25682.1 hypothetical protein Nmn1133_02585 [Salella cibi]